MRVYLHTLGCKVNQHESQFAMDTLASTGHRIVADICLADMALINTCTVTQVADKKSRQMIRQLARKNASAKIIITGCMPENPSAPIEIPAGAAIVLKQDLNRFLVSLPGADLGLKEPPVRGRARKTLLVQTGCDYFCSYCIIPMVRHGGRSVSVSQVQDDFNKLVEKGVKEVVLTGINIGTWKDQQLDFTGLLRELLKRPGDYRLRLGSLEPNVVSDSLLDLISNEPRIAPHLHIPLQGASDNLLKKMRRRYRIDDYFGLINKIQDLPRSINLTTDIIIGFPSETETDVAAALDLINRPLFLDVHAFTYSSRKGTTAAEMEPVPTHLASERMKKVLAAIELAKKKILSSFAGRRARVLIESGYKGKVVGYTEGYVKVLVPVRDMGPNQFMDIKLGGLTPIGKEWGLSALI